MNIQDAQVLADEALDYAKTYNVPLDSAIEHVMKWTCSGVILPGNGLAAVKLLIAQKLKGRGESDVDAVKRFFKADFAEMGVQS